MQAPTLAQLVAVGIAPNDASKLSDAWASGSGSARLSVQQALKAHRTFVHSISAASREAATRPRSA
jgi:hypothetical protein